MESPMRNEAPHEIEGYKGEEPEEGGFFFLNFFTICDKFLSYFFCSDFDYIFLYVSEHSREKNFLIYNFCRFFFCFLISRSPN